MTRDIVLFLNYTYRCAVEGDTEWFQGHETIWLGETQIYECYFYGSSIR